MTFYIYFRSEFLELYYEGQSLFILSAEAIRRL